MGAEDVATHFEHVELNLLLDGVDETPPVTGREIRGDWAPKPYVDPATGATYYKYDDLGNIERLPGVPSTGDVEPDQWLDGSSGADLIVTGDFDEQAHGDAGDDFIIGSDNSPATSSCGGAGDDRIEGGGWADHAAEYWEWEYLGRPMGLGDDKIYGGAGDDQIWGESEATQAALDDAGTAPTGITGDWLDRRQRRRPHLRQRGRRRAARRRGRRPAGRRRGHGRAARRRRLPDPARGQLLAGGAPELRRLDAGLRRFEVGLFPGRECDHQHAGPHLERVSGDPSSPTTSTAAARTC